MEPTKTLQEQKLETAPIGRLLARFAIPSIIAMVINSLYNIADQIFIGKGVGYLGNGATNVVFLITLITLSLSMLLGDGTAAFFSLRLGEGDKKLAARGVGNTLLTLAGVSAICLLAGLSFLEPILRLFGATDLILPLAMDYGRIVVMGLPLIMSSTALNAVIRADGSPKFAMASMILGAVVNVILDPIFIFTLDMGVKGAAITNVIGQGISFVLSAAYLWRFKCIKLTRAAFVPQLSIIGKTAALGISSFIDQMSFTLVMAVNNNLIVAYGASTIYGSEIPLTAFGISMKVQQILFSVVLGIAVGMQPIVGYNYGAKNYKRVKKACYIAMGSATAACFLGSILLVGFPNAVIGLFGSEGNALYVAFSTQFFRTYFLLITFLGFQTVAGIFFQAIGKPLKASVISLSYQIVFRVLSAIALCTFMGLEGVLWSGPFADLMTFLLAAVLITAQMRSMKKLGDTAPLIK